MAENLVAKEGHLIAYGSSFPLEGVSKALATVRRRWGVVLTLFLLCAVPFTLYALAELQIDVKTEESFVKSVKEKYYEATAPQWSLDEQLRHSGMGKGLPQQRFVRRMMRFGLWGAGIAVVVFAFWRTPCIALTHWDGRTTLVDVWRSDKAQIPGIVQAINDAIPASPPPASG